MFVGQGETVEVSTTQLCITKISVLNYMLVGSCRVMSAIGG